ncbi:MAG: aminopeptidase [Candidatus Faecousia sp.]|nr:aminopeptidase [Clostridiales bacterium]MDY6180995.1 aminopeptidase [Candidatus Faecousia sp.]
MKKATLRAYARLIVQSGINVQKGQEVLIYADLDQPEFVQMVVEEAYRAKASKVIVEWNYAPLEKIHVRHQSVKTLGNVEKWQLERQEHFCEAVPARIHLVSEDPDGLKGMNMEKVAKSRQMRYPILKPYLDRLEGAQQWCIAAVPGVAWAKKVFPGMRASAAVEKLWEAILVASRVDEDPVAAWEKHNADLASRCDYLNSLGIQKLHYTADNGTDFTVGMIPEAQFCGGGEVSRRGIFFNPNIPTEECFISPMKGQAEGIVYATKPLSYQGQLIEDFSIRFENGRAVEVKAAKGEELLKTMISMDEGAAYLGECALVPQVSPIAQSGILFYNTLFDENAACHLALGMGFADTIRDHHNKTLEECRELGINDSMIHEDFMIGCDSMNIDAICADGSLVPVFRGGNWAF